MKTRLDFFAWVLLGLSITLSFGAFFKAREWDRERLSSEFPRRAENGAELLQEKIEHHLALLYGIQSFFASSHSVEREEFGTFVEGSLARHPELVFLQWVARVPAAEKEAFEASVRQEGFPGAQVFENGPGGGPVRAEDREEYFPVTYSEPLEKSRSRIGSDLGSERLRLEAMEIARDTGKAAATPWIGLHVSTDEDPKGFRLFLPIYRNGAPHDTLQQRRDNLAGFAVAVCKIGTLLEVALRDWETGTIELFLREEGAVSGDSVYRYGLGRGSLVNENPEEMRGITWKGEVRVGGEKWLLTFRPTAKYFSGQSGIFPGLVLAMGLLVSLLVFGTVRNITVRTSTVEKIVDDRTKELTLLTEQLTQNNAELVRREQLMKALIEEAPDPIVVLTPAGIVQSVNRAARNVSGYSQEEMVGKSMVAVGVVAKGSIPRALKELALVVAGAERPPFELEIVRKKGGPITFEINPRLMRVSGGAPSILVVFRDVTQRKQEEKESRERADNLAQKNEEMQKQENVMRSLLEDLTFSKERLEEKSREVEAANRKLQEMAALKDDFVAKVSHELRTPLTSIKEGLNLMLDGVLGETTADQKDFLRTMDGDLDRLAELINNMLDLSKIESGRMQLVRRRVEMPELIRSTLRSYQSIAAGRQVVEKFQPAPEVFIDYNRMLQVLGNLFSNAVKYGKEEGAITFGVEPRNGSVLVWVEDEGEGITPEEIPKLFQKFSQVGRMDRNRPKGTGLGLVVCKELVELQGGRIEVESKVGKGTRFTVHLPAYTDELALKESFRDIKELDEGTSVGLITLLVGESPAGPPLSRKELDRIAGEVRQRLHHADIVFGMEPGWVVIFAATDAKGIQAMVRRLQQSLPEAGRFRFGTALYPADGKDAQALFEQARKSLDQGLAAGPRPGVRP